MVSDGEKGIGIEDWEGAFRKRIVSIEIHFVSTCFYCVDIAYYFKKNGKCSL